MPPGTENVIAFTASTAIGIITIVVAVLCLFAYVLGKNAPRGVRMLILLVLLISVLTFGYSAYQNNLERYPHLQRGVDTESAPAESAPADEGPGGTPGGVQPQ